VVKTIIQRTIAVTGALLFACVPFHGQSRTVRYSYDAAGRLIGVDLGGGSGITYAYDRAGNLLSQTVGAVTVPSITQVTPTSGPVGTVVTIAGVNLTDGTVDFNGKTARLLSSSAGQLTVVVPEGATSGPITVKTSSGSASSLSVFTVTAGATQLTFAVQRGGAASSSTIGPYNSLSSGYATAAVNSGTTPYATAVFSYTQDGVVVSEVGVPASPTTQSARIFIDIRSRVSTRGGIVDILTGLAAVNLGTGTANVALTLRDPGGATLASGTTRLAANGHIAKFLHQLAPDFVLPASFSGFGSLDVTSDQPLSLLALRLTTNSRGDLLLTSTPVVDLSRPAPSGTLLFPQVADGDGYETTLILLNTSSETETGTVRFIDDTGSALTVRLASGGNAAGQFPYSIPPRGLVRIVTDGSPSKVNIGWAQVSPDSGSASPVGAGIFSYSPEGVLITESGVPSAVATSRALIYVDRSGGHDTGLAVSNPTRSSLRLTMNAYQADGVTLAGSGAGTLDLSPEGHEAKFVGQLVPGGIPAGFTGVLDISGSAAFAALTLRSLINARGDFLLTTFPIADATRPAPSQLVFPQIANGDGYQTQFIFLAPGGVAGSVTLRFLGDNGAPIEVGKTP
jgi:YD repeat-containing protein